MGYLLDTNACIALNKLELASVRGGLQRALKAGAQVWVPTIVLCELWYAVVKSGRPKENAEEAGWLDGMRRERRNFLFTRVPGEGTRKRVEKILFALEGSQAKEPGASEAA